MLPGCIQLDSESELMTPEIVLMQFRASQQFIFKHNNFPGEPSHVAHVEEWWLPTPKVSSSNPVPGTIFKQETY